MNKIEAIRKMVAPGQRRRGKWRDGVIQIWMTRVCDLSCANCTQSSQLKGGHQQGYMSLKNLETSLQSLDGYFGVVGMFGGNPALHPQFEEACELFRKHVPFEQRGIWCNHPRGKGKIMRETFNPRHSNLNVHLKQEAYDEFKQDWPESNPVGLTSDSRHSPVLLAMDDLDIDESEMWGKISNCDINKHWSAMIGQVHNVPRAYFCEIAGMQDMLKAFKNPDHKPFGIYPNPGWWRLSIERFSNQIENACIKCGVPMRGYGALSQGPDVETVELTTDHWFNIQNSENSRKPKRLFVEVDNEKDVNSNLTNVVDYIGNSKR